MSEAAKGKCVAIIWLLLFIVLVAQAQGRDPKQVAAFRRMFPCPSTGKTSGACAGWVVDHVVPLCWGGEDAPVNMQWQEVRQSYLKDRFEREACAMKKKVEQPFGTLENGAPDICFTYNSETHQFQRVKECSLPVIKNKNQ